MWLLFSLTAAFFWATTNTIDKYLLSKRNLNPFFVLFILCCMDFVAGLIFFLAFQGQLSMNMLYGLLIGLIIPLADILYFKSIQDEEISRVVPWFELSTILVAIGGAIFLNEILEIRQYAGMLVILTSLWLLTVKDKIAIKLDRWVFLMIFASILVTLMALAEKYLLAEMNPFVLFGTIGMGSLLGFTPFLIWKRKTIGSGLKNNAGSIKVIFFSELSGLTAILLTLLALNSGLVTLVSVFSSFQYLFLLLIAILMTLFKPEVMKEVFSKKLLSLKLLAVILVILGIYLINV